MSTKPLTQDALVKGARFILSETFESPRPEGSAYLDQGAGLLDTLEQLTAEQASSPPAPGLHTIAAHAEHTRYHLAAMNAFARGQEQTLDWEASWSQQQVDQASWRKLIAGLVGEYNTLQDLLEHHQNWDERSVGGVIGTIAHLAYHLGAMRQLIRLLGQTPPRT